MAQPINSQFSLDGDDVAGTPNEVPQQALPIVGSPAEPAADDAQGFGKGGLLKAAGARMSTLISTAKSKAETIQQKYIAKRPTAEEEGVHGGPDLAPVPAPTPAPLPVPGTPITTALVAAAADFGKKTRESGLSAYHATMEGIKKLTTPAKTIGVVCKQELRTRPCPQLLLTCCTVITLKGLSTYGIFRSDAPVDKLERLLANADAGMVLLPSDMDPLLAASAIKHFLADLAQPLLLSKLADRWLACAEDLDQVGPTLATLPVFSLSTLRVLLETCYRIASNFNLTGMNALGLAEQLAPVLLWRETESALTRALPTLPTFNANIQAIKARLAGTKLGTDPSTAEEGADAGAAAAGTVDEQSNKKRSSGGGDGSTTAAQPPSSTLPASQTAEDDPLMEDIPVSPISVRSNASDSGAAGAGQQGRSMRLSGLGSDMGELEGEEGLVVGDKVPLTAAERELVVRVLEHMILNFEELF